VYESLPEQPTLEGFFIGEQGDTMNGQVDIREAAMEDVPAIIEIWK